VRALRLKKGLTQEALAERASLDYKYYQRFELGATPAPVLTTLEGLAKALGVKPWLLLCDEPALVRARTGLENPGKRVLVKPGRPRKARTREAP